MWSAEQERWQRNSKFLANPQLQLRLAQPSELRIRLQRGKLSRTGDESAHADRGLLLRSTEAFYGGMLGLYVLRADGQREAERLKLPARGYAGLHVVSEAAFVPLESTEVRLALPPLEGGAPYVLVPCLFGQGLVGGYTLEVTSSAPGMTLAEVGEQTITLPPKLSLGAKP